MGERVNGGSNGEEKGWDIRESRGKKVRLGEGSGEGKSRVGIVGKVRGKERVGLKVMRKGRVKLVRKEGEGLKCFRKIMDKQRERLT